MKSIIALVGERDIAKRAHAGIEASLALYRQESGVDVESRWVPTSAITASSAESVFSEVSGVWCTPGSPYANTSGAIAAIRWARERGVAFFGTCGGFQHALMEYCSTVLGRLGAHEETDSEIRDPLIARLSCSLVEVRATIVAPAQGWYARIVGSERSEEEFHCNYGLSSSFEPYFSGSGLEFVARDEAAQVRVFRLVEHPFFAGSLFQPERRALRGSLHPFVREFFRHT